MNLCQCGDLVFCLQNGEHFIFINSLVPTKHFFSQNKIVILQIGGAFECIEVLLTLGAKVDLVDAKEQTPLFVAVINRHLEAARLIVQNHTFSISIN